MIPQQLALQEIKRTIEELLVELICIMIYYQIVKWVIFLSTLRIMSKLNAHFRLLN